MENQFIVFWRLYAPMAEYCNRYIACQRLWDGMEEKNRLLILQELTRQKETEPPTVHEKNPYFYLIDWQPPQAQWLTPKEVAHMLAERIPLAVCYNPQTNAFGTVTKADAEWHQLTVHHYM